jgi:hypothetical integral membrane protein (TIGR02206 family)
MPGRLSSAMPPVFTPFSAMHGWAMVAGIAGTSAVIAFGKSSERNEKIARGLLAFLCLAAFGYSQAAWGTIEGDPDLDSSLPLHLCDLAAIIAGFALITRHPLLCLLTYIWGLAATVQALLTPAITVGFPHPAFITFFVHHFSVVAAAFYLPLVMGWRAGRPWWKAPLKAWLWGNLYVVVSLAVNAWLGTNFGFTARKPENPSLLDHMGPWPYYIFAMQGVAAVLFTLLALPVLGKKSEPRSR